MYPKAPDLSSGKGNFPIKGNPREINNLLRGIVDRIVVDPDGEFVVFLR